MSGTMQAITLPSNSLPTNPHHIFNSGKTEDDENSTQNIAQNSRKISFPADSILNAVIQDGDVLELLNILQFRFLEVDLNHKNHSGLTALHYAVLTNNLDTVKLLLSYGADVTSQDIYGFSPLHTAAALGFLHMASLLILYGADVFAMTDTCELPIDLAKDISVIRTLSNEMYIKLQSENYLRSASLNALKCISKSVLKFLLCLIQRVLFFFHIMLAKCFQYLTKCFTSKSPLMERNLMTDNNMNAKTIETASTNLSLGNIQLKDVCSNKKTK